MSQYAPDQQGAVLRPTPTMRAERSELQAPMASRLLAYVEARLSHQVYWFIPVEMRLTALSSASVDYRPRIARTGTGWGRPAEPRPRRDRP